MLRLTFALTAAFMLISASPARDVFKPDRAYFFVNCAVVHDWTQISRTKALKGSAARLTDAHKTAINDIFDQWERYGDANGHELAYILATVRRESDGTWLPIREVPRCKEDEACRERKIGKLLEDRARQKYAAKAAAWAKAGKTVPPFVAPVNYAAAQANGNRYYGRGYIQLTGPGAYRRADVELRDGTSLYEQPDGVMKPDIAAQILVRAMVQGWFGKRVPLSTWLARDPPDWLDARDNVNPGSPHKPITAFSAKEIDLCLKRKS